MPGESCDGPNILRTAGPRRAIDRVLRTAVRRRDGDGSPRSAHCCTSAPTTAIGPPRPCEFAVKKARLADHIISFAAITSVTALYGSAAPALASALPIAKGSYVARSDSPCQSAAFADVVNFDGMGFGDPHSSKCISTVLESYGRHYRVDTVCRAMGDGAPLDKPERVIQDIVVKSRTVISIMAGGHSSTYALCPGFGDA